MTTSETGRRQARRVLDRRREELVEWMTRDTPPRGGWLQAIRESLGMSAADLGSRLGVNASTVLRTEASERDDHVGLGTLRRAADALGCDLVYALVPRRSLESMVDDRLRAQAERHVRQARHLMLLEDQRVAESVSEEQLRDQVEALRGRPGLWRDA